MLSNTPDAPLILTSSNGDSRAARIAASARSMPFPLPMAIHAGPASRITVRRSAKSRLISPGISRSSVIDCMACRSTSSAILNAAAMDIAGSATSSSRSFGITTSVSTSLASQFNPRFACCCR